MNHAPTSLLSGRARIFDVRTGEARIALGGFAVALLLIIAAHTVMETARDTLLLTGPGPRALGLVYIGIAASALPASAVAARVGERFGQRRALAGMLVLAVLAGVVMFLVPTGPTAAMATYIVSGLLGSILVPQFWTLAGTAFTPSQGRRLFGLIAAAGVIGGVLGPSMSAAALVVVPVKALLLLSAAVFCLAGVAVARMPVVERAVPPRDEDRSEVGQSIDAFRSQPLLGGVAVVVVLSTAALLAVDYLFKSTLASALPKAEVGPFIARFYLALNFVSLLVQLFASGTLVRQIGVAASMLMTPMLLSGSAAIALATGGALAAVLLIKGIDGSLRYSIHRITEELLYLPVPQTARQRAKPLIDGAFSRTAQTLTGAALFFLGGSGVVPPRQVAGLVLVLTTLWLGAALAVRRPYMDLLRKAICSDTLDPSHAPAPIDNQTTELLVQRLSSEDPLEVAGAVSALVRHGRSGLVPGLLLMHPDQTVLTHALEVFGASDRADWWPLAQRLLEDPREAVRVAAARALTLHGKLDARLLARDDGVRPRAYAAVALALKSGQSEVLADPTVAALMRFEGDAAAAAHLGLLAAIADAPPSPSLSLLLLALCARHPLARGEVELLATAAARQGEMGAIPRLVELLSQREGREAIRQALVALGEPAFEAVSVALRDPTLPRQRRLHVPRTLARFGSNAAAERLLACIETERDGFVRFKAIRALGSLVAEQRVHLDRARVERLCVTELVRHLGSLAALVALGLTAAEVEHGRSPAQRLLAGLLEDKMRHSLERAFRLLQIARPRERIHPVYLACLSRDPYARANASELLDALLRHSDERVLRALMVLVADDLPARERVERAKDVVPIAAPRTADEALRQLLGSEDVTLASLAGLCAMQTGDEGLRAAFEEARRARPEIDPGGALAFDDAISRRVAHA
jgi:AAA family ATP:ADP antiporter